MLKRETIIDEVGEEALECNHLIGHEDTIFDMVVDTLIRLFKSSWGIKIETFGFFTNRQIGNNAKLASKALLCENEKIQLHF